MISKSHFIVKRQELYVSNANDFLSCVKVFLLIVPLSFVLELIMNSMTPNILVSFIMILRVLEEFLIPLSVLLLLIVFFGINYLRMPAYLKET